MKFTNFGLVSLVLASNLTMLPQVFASYAKSSSYGRGGGAYGAPAPRPDRPYPQAFECKPLRNSWLKSFIADDAGNVSITVRANYRFKYTNWNVGTYNGKITKVQALNDTSDNLQMMISGAVPSLALEIRYSPSIGTASLYDAGYLSADMDCEVTTQSPY